MNSILPVSQWITGQKQNDTLRLNMYTLHVILKVYIHRKLDHSRILQYH